MPDSPTLEYSRPPSLLLSKIALGFGIASVPLFFVGVVGLAALVIAVVAGRLATRQPERYGGVGFARVGGWLGGGSVIVAVLLVGIMMPSRGGSSKPPRAYCGANLRGIVQALVVYATLNDGAFPTVPYAPYTAALNNPVATTMPGTASDVVRAVFARPPANVAGSPVAGVWLLALQTPSYISPRMLICREDPFVTMPAPSVATAPATGPAAPIFNNVPASGLSYSFAYPWSSDGRVGPWWRNTDSAVPLASDIAPLEGTGRPRRRLRDPTASGPALNSPNHRGAGQNVVFADGHVEFVRTSRVGQDNDNIFTTSGTGRPDPLGTPPTPLFPPIPSLPPHATDGRSTYPGPYDIIMVPVRNCSTGGM